MSEEKMTPEQYRDLTRSIKNLSSDVNKLHGKFTNIDEKVTSISNWVTGDPNIPSSTGSEDKLQSMEERIKLNEASVKRIEKLEAIELKVDDHEKRITKVYTTVGVVGVITFIIGTLLGIFVPPYLG